MIFDYEQRIKIYGGTSLRDTYVNQDGITLFKSYEPDIQSIELVRHSPFAFYGWALNYPKQFEVIRKWIEIQPKITVLTGWKRTGKTFCAVYLMTCWFMNEIRKGWFGAKSMGIKENFKWPVPPLRERIAWIGGKSSDHIENTLVPMYKTILPQRLISKDITKNDKRILGHNNTKFVLRTYEQDLETWKSGSADMVHLDEEPPLAVMNECLSRTTTTNGKIFITVAIDDADVSWLPDACTNPIKYFGTDSFLHMKMGVEDVPTEIYPEEEKKAVYMKYDGTQFESAVRKGEFAYIAGRWWKEFSPEDHIIDPFPIPDYWLKFRFMDAGFAAPTACLWVAMHPKGHLFIYREFYKKNTTIEERCQAVIEMSGNKRQRDGDYWIEVQNKEKYMGTYLDYHEFKADPIRGDGLDYYYIKEGLIVQPATTLGQEARREVINKILSKDMTKKHFITGSQGAPRMYIFNNCHNLIYEAQKKSVKRERSERHGVSERKIDNCDDHAMDCAEYAACELENWAGEYDR